MSPELGPGDATQLVNDGPVIEVHVGRPRQPLRNYRALIDTGADLCYIDIAVARELDLQKIDVHRPIGVEGKRVVVPVFRATIRVGSVDVSMNDPCPAYSIRAMSGHRLRSRIAAPKTCQRSIP